MAVDSVLILLGLVLLLALTLLVLLGRGSERSLLVREGLSLANGALAGKLDVRKVQVFINGHVILEGVRLTGRDGLLVGELSRLETHVDLKQLTHQAVVLHRTAVTGLRLYLTTDPLGDLNLIKAVGPATPGPPTSASTAPSGPGWTVQMDEAAIDLADLSYGPSESAQVDAELRQAKLRGRFELDSLGEITASLAFDKAQLEKPVSEPVSLTARLAIGGGRLLGSLALDVEDSRLAAEADLDLVNLSGRLTVPQLWVGPRLADRYLPGLQARGLQTRVAATLHGGVLHLESAAIDPLPIDGPAPIAAASKATSAERRAVVQVTGDFALATGDGSLAVDVQRLDVQRFLAALPLTDLNLSSKGRFTDLTHDARAGTFLVTIDRSSWDGAFVGPGHVRGQRAGPMLLFSDIDLAVPGARVAGRAELLGARLEVGLDLSAPNVGELRSAVEGVAKVNLPDFAGNLAGQIHIAGPLRDLALNAELRSSVLTLNGVRATATNLQVHAPQLGRHLDIHTSASLGTFEAGGQLLRDVGLTVDWTTPTLTALAKLKFDKDEVEIWTRATVPNDLLTADLAELELSLPGGEWKLQAPAHADFRHGVAVSGLNLAADDQTLSIDLATQGERLEALATLGKFNLTAIPKALLGGRPLSGRLDGDLHFTTTPQKRDLEADLRMSDAAYGPTKVPLLQVTGRLTGDALSATLSGQVGSALVEGRFAGPLPEGVGELQGNLQVHQLQLQDLEPFVPQLRDYRGQVDLHLALTGNWNAPTVELLTLFDDLTGPWNDEPALLGHLTGTLKLTVDEARSALSLRVVDRGQPVLGVRLGPGIEVLNLLAHAPLGGKQLAALQRTPKKLLPALRGAAVTASLHTEALPLAVVNRLIADLPALGGNARLTGDFEGTLAAPRGNLTATVGGLRLGDRRLGALELDVASHDEGVSAHLALQTPNASAAAGVKRPDDEPGGTLKADLHWGLRAEALADRAARQAATVRATVRAERIAMPTLLGGEPTLAGLLALQTDVRGTLLAPNATAGLQVTELEVVGRSLGRLAAEAKWDGAALTAKLQGEQPPPPQLAQADPAAKAKAGKVSPGVEPPAPAAGGSLEGSLNAPLTEAGLGEGPLRARLKLVRFDLAALEASLVERDLLRALAGVVDAELEVGGTRLAPAPNGHLELRDGKLALAGLGEFDKVSLRAQVAPDRLDVQSLELSSGQGPLKANASLVRDPQSGKFALSGKVDTQHFGIYAADQLRAQFTGHIDLGGTVAAKDTQIEAKISAASINLPNLLQKSLGPTSLDSDIRFGPAPRAAAPETSAAAAVDDAAASAPPGFHLLLHVIAPGPIPIEGPDLSLQAKADLWVQLQGELGMRGLAQVTSGRVSAYNHTFDVDHANVQFGDDQNFGPVLEAHLDAEADQQVSDYKLAIVVGGRLDHPIPELSSDPPLSENRIAELLLTGSADSDPTGGAQSSGGGNGALSLGGQVIGSLIKDALGPAMPLDVLILEPNRAEAGKRLTPQLYIGGVTNYTNVDPRVNGAELHARYDLTRHWALDGRYGNAQAGTFDLIWRYSW